MAARPSRLLTRAVWILAAIGVGATGVLAWSFATSASEVTFAAVGSAISLTACLAAFVLCGAIIVSKQPDNVVGRLLMIPGLALPLSTLATNWLAALDAPPQQATPALWLVLWVLTWSWILLIFPIFHLLLTFPDGRLLSRRWRWAVALEVVMVATMLTFAALSQDMGVVIDDEKIWTIANPIGIVPNDLFDSAFGGIWDAGLLLMTVVSATAVVVRFRRGSPDVRQQLKWPLLAVFGFGFVYGATAVDPRTASDGSFLFAFALAGIPISVAIAVLRYRLYAIDRILSRTVSWAVITALLLAVFVALVFVIQAILVGVTQAQTVAVAASTLLAAALFQPLRARVQRVVDRRFDRARVDGERTSARFSERLRGQVAIESIVDDLQATVEASIRPTAQALWLRGARGRSPSAGS
ncbi:MAG TPA: hypothetical protein VIZ22_01575 [Candidatus Limnocylindrales bacterium]